MKKSFAKQTLSVFLAIIMMVLSLPVAFAAEPTVLATGDCGAEGDNVKWILTDDHVLTIRGTGAMRDGPYYLPGSLSYSYSLLAIVYGYLFYAEEWELIKDSIHELGYNFESVLDIIEAQYNQELSDEEFETIKQFMELKLFQKCGYYYDTWEDLSNAINSGEISDDEVEAVFSGEVYSSFVDAAKAKMPQKLIIEEGVTTVGDYAFCPEYPTGKSWEQDFCFLQTISLPSTLQSIGNYAFGGNGCNITIPENVKSIGKYAFYGVPFETLVLPISCTHVGEGAFTLSNSTKDVFIDNDEITLDEGAIQIPIYDATTDLTETELLEYIDMILAYNLFLQLKLNSASENDPLDLRMYISAIQIEYLGDGFDYLSHFSPSQDTLLANLINRVNEILHTDFSSVEDMFTTEEESVEPTAAFKNAVLEWNAAFGSLNITTTSLGRERKEKWQPYPWLTIHGNSGSVAEQLATASGVKFDNLGHHYTATVTKTVSCTEDGVKSYYCAHCGDTYTVAIPATGHSYGQWMTKTEPTATTEGLRVKVCSVCGDEISRVIPAVGQPESWLDPKTDVGITYDEDAFDGVMDLVVEVIPVFDPFVRAWNITPTVNGEKVQPKKPVQIRLPIPAGWDKNGITVVHTDSNGHTEYPAFTFEDHYVVFWVSSFSEYRLEYQEPEVHEHQYTATVTTEPTCSEPGETTYTCSCGDTYTEPIPATGTHTDDNNDGKCDTCNQKMTGGKHCKYCGKIHGGAFGWLVKFFHSVFAIFKR